MNFLALDLGQKTGWAKEVNGKITHGCERMGKAKSKEGARYTAFRHFIADILDNNKIDLVVYEEPGRFPNAHANNQMRGYRAIVHGECAEREIVVDSLSPKALKKWATKDGNASKDPMIRYAELATCEKMADHNAADAVCLLFWAKDQDWALEEVGE